MLNLEYGFNRCQITGALFYDTELQGSDLSGVDLRGAKFGDTMPILMGTKFVNADMRNIGYTRRS